MSGGRQQYWPVVEHCLKENLYPTLLRWHPYDPNVFLVSKKRLNQRHWTPDDVRHYLHWDIVAGRKPREDKKYFSESRHRYLTNLDRMVTLGELQPAPELDTDGLAAYRLISEGSSPWSTCAESDAGTFNQNTGPVGAETEGKDLMTLAIQRSGIFAPDACGDLSLDAQGKIQPRHVFADGEPAVASSSHHSRQQISSLPEHEMVTVGIQTKKEPATLQFPEETLGTQETSSPGDVNMSSQEEPMDAQNVLQEFSRYSLTETSSLQGSVAPKLSNEGILQMPTFDCLNDLESLALPCVATASGNSSSQDKAIETRDEMSDTSPMDWGEISSFDNTFAPELSNEGALRLPTNKIKNGAQVCNDVVNYFDENGCQNMVYDVPRFSPPSFKNMQTDYPNTVFNFEQPNVMEDANYDLINYNDTKSDLDLWFETQFDFSLVPHLLENVTGEENTVDDQYELDKHAGDDVRLDSLDELLKYLDGD